MSKRRRKYTEEFKRRAVELSHSNGCTVRETAESLGIPVSILHRRRTKYTESGELS